VDRVRSPELVGTAEVSDRDPVSQGYAGERVVWQDLYQNKDMLSEPAHRGEGPGGEGGEGGGGERENKE
jgi:hypothetical protein